jgi:hypothetical protein
MSEAGTSGGDVLTARVGELRRLTILFCDVVGSTELSGRWEPETYRELMSRYRTACREVIESEFEGHIVQNKGDGILAVFGFPVAHENDAERAVRAGLELVRAVDALPHAANVDQSLAIRVAVHNGLFVDFDRVTCTVSQPTWARLGDRRARDRRPLARVYSSSSAVPRRARRQMVKASRTARPFRVVRTPSSVLRPGRRRWWSRTRARAPPAKWARASSGAPERCEA